MSPIIILPPIDPDKLTEEERRKMKKIGKRTKTFVTIGFIATAIFGVVIAYLNFYG